MELSDQLHTLAALLPGTHWVGGWVCPRTSLDAFKYLTSKLKSTHVIAIVVKQKYDELNFV
jgi:hypothetical protein